MFLFTILALILLWLQQAEGNDAYQLADDGSSFSHQVAAAGCAAYSYNSSFNDNLVQVQ